MKDLVRTKLTTLLSVEVADTTGFRLQTRQPCEEVKMSKVELEGRESLKMNTTRRTRWSRCFRITLRKRVASASLPYHHFTITTRQPLPMMLRITPSFISNININTSAKTFSYAIKMASTVRHH